MRQHQMREKLLQRRPRRRKPPRKPAIQPNSWSRLDPKTHAWRTWEEAVRSLIDSAPELLTRAGVSTSPRRGRGSRGRTLTRWCPPHTASTCTRLRRSGGGLRTLRRRAITTDAARCAARCAPRHAQPRRMRHAPRGEHRRRARRHDPARRPAKQRHCGADTLRTRGGRHEVGSGERAGAGSARWPVEWISICALPIEQFHKVPYSRAAISSAAAGQDRVGGEEG